MRIGPHVGSPIYTAAGVVEGFPDEARDKIGFLTCHDTKTMGRLNATVFVPDVGIFVGNIADLQEGK